MTGLRVPAGAGESEISEKRSRFLGHLQPVETEEEAKAFIQKIKKAYHDARHNCWCYRLDGGIERFSDDGEPQGSAGKPMLEVFRHEETVNFVCVVTRYFGGVLLGTGGLSRAYAGAAKEALTNAGTKITGKWAILGFRCSYAQLDRCRNLIESFSGEIEDLDYGSDVGFRAILPLEKSENFASALIELSGGSMKPETIGTVRK